jgi:hypothetical protein
MMILKAVFIIVTFHLSVNAYTPEKYKEFIEQVLSKPDYKIDFANNVKQLVEKEPNYFNYSPFKAYQGFTFDCNTQDYTSLVTPKSVHQLKPGDINVVAAMGDSITGK